MCMLKFTVLIAVLPPYWAGGGGGGEGREGDENIDVRMILLFTYILYQSVL